MGNLHTYWSTEDHYTLFNCRLHSGLVEGVSNSHTYWSTEDHYSSFKCRLYSGLVEWVIFTQYLFFYFSLSFVLYIAVDCVFPHLLHSLYFFVYGCTYKCTEFCISTFNSTYYSIIPYQHSCQVLSCDRSGKATWLRIDFYLCAAWLFIGEPVLIINPKHNLNPEPGTTGPDYIFKNHYLINADKFVASNLTNLL